jgi:hypothetical protein
MGLILSIVLPDIGAKAYLITLLSPYAGIYYWKNAQREDVFKIKMETSDDDQITNLINNYRSQHFRWVDIARALGISINQLNYKKIRYCN